MDWDRPGRGRGVAYARAALAGNPSDGYGGAVLAVTLPGWRAEAEAVQASEPHTEPPSALVEATERRLVRRLGGPHAAVRWSTSIPQRVGLGSSSALAIAVIRAVCELHAAALEPSDVAELALAVETEDLGIAAGLQDRVVQAHEGLVFMEFGERRYESLDPALLPPLVIAWREDAAAGSGAVHQRLGERHRRGERLVLDAMAELASAARAARSALLAHDRALFAECVNRTFEARNRMLALDERCVAMVETARAAGAGANYTGSGGAIVAVCRDRRHAGEVAGTLERSGCGVAQYG